MTHYRVLDMSEPCEALCYDGSDGLVLEIDGEWESSWGDDWDGLMGYLHEEFGVDEDDLIEDRYSDMWDRYGWTAER